MVDGRPKTDTITISLASPVTFNGERFAELTFLRPDARMVRRACTYSVDIEAGPKAAAAALFASMCGMPLAAFKKVRVRDMVTIAAAMVAFLSDDPVLSSQQSIGDSYE